MPKKSTGSFFQEKFEFIMPLPRKNEAIKQWGSYEDDVRDPVDPFQSVANGNLNVLPPGQHIELQAGTSVIDDFGPLMFGGARSEDSCSDKDEYIRKGFRRLDLEPTDDNYTGESADAFYNTVEGEEGKGFVERHNYLDRY